MEHPLCKILHKGVSPGLGPFSQKYNPALKGLMLPPMPLLFLAHTSLSSLVLICYHYGQHLLLSTIVYFLGENRYIYRKCFPFIFVHMCCAQEIDVLKESLKMLKLYVCCILCSDANHCSFTFIISTLIYDWDVLTCELQWCQKVIKIKKSQ